MTGLVSAITALIAFIITAGLGFVIIPFLRRLKFGQTIKEIGPTWHKNKQGTPTMGGLMFIAGIVLASVVGCLVAAAFSGGESISSTQELVRFVAGLCLALGMGMIGFADDYIKVVKKRNLGLTARQKTLLQLLGIIAYLAVLYLAGDTSTIVVFPFLGQLDFGLFYYPLVAVGIYFLVNAVNLTDGIDGLASSVTFVVGIAFMVISSLLSFTNMGVLASAMAAGCLGFLMWNLHPAKVFMGDTGSMFLGGLVVALGMGVGMPMLLVFAGIVYICEALSVVLQVISFKTTGKRIFKMSPIHHHFEMCGWSEGKIVTVFSLVTAVFCAVAVCAVIWG